MTGQVWQEPWLVRLLSGECTDWPGEPISPPVVWQALWLVEADVINHLTILFRSLLISRVIHHLNVKVI